MRIILVLMFLVFAAAVIFYLYRGLVKIFGGGSSNSGTPTQQSSGPVSGNAEPTATAPQAVSVFNVLILPFTPAVPIIPQPLLPGQAPPAQQPPQQQFAQQQPQPQQFMQQPQIQNNPAR